MGVFVKISIFCQPVYYFMIKLHEYFLSSSHNMDPHDQGVGGGRGRSADTDTWWYNSRVVWPHYIFDTTT